MEYQGADIYKFYLDDKEVELSKYDIEKIFIEYNKYNEHNNTDKNILSNEHNNTDKNISSIFEPRKYYKKSYIKSLFQKYHDENKTKKEVFAKISLKLKISYKAVEKAYYSK